MLTNMHPAPKEGNYCDEYGNAIRPKLLRTTINTWSILTKAREWKIATLSLDVHSSG
jgi:hypothetical protein